MRPLYTEIFFVQVFIIGKKYQVSSGIALPRGHGYFLARKFLVLGSTASQVPLERLCQNRPYGLIKKPRRIVKIFVRVGPSNLGKAAKI
jgi:hypothetical protein